MKFFNAGDGVFINLEHVIQVSFYDSATRATLILSHGEPKSVTDGEGLKFLKAFVREADVKN